MFDIQITRVYLLHLTLIMGYFSPKCHCLSALWCHIKLKTRGSQEPISLTWDKMQLNGSDDIYLTWRQLRKHIKTLQEITSYWNRHIALMVPSCSSNQITPWYQFSLKSDKVNILSMAAILKTRGSQEPESLTWIPKHNSMPWNALPAKTMQLETKLW